jgi:hypothetical protein
LLRFPVASRQFDDDVLNLLVEIEPDASRKLYKALSRPVPAATPRQVK